MKISLIIPTYNREEFLVDTLECALYQNFDSYEIIVVDQTKKHKPETELYINSIKDKINYIFLPEPSLTKARNIGVKASKGEVILMIDDDTSFNNNLLSAHWEAHQKGYDIVSGRVDSEYVKIAKRPVWVSKWFNFRGSENSLTSGYTNKMAGCNGSFKRKVYVELGGFDENFYNTAVCEDTDFGYRAWQRGYKVYFDANAFLFHRVARTGGANNRSINLRLDPSYYFGLLYFAKKNLPIYTYYWLRFRYYIKAFKYSFLLVKSVIKSVDKSLQK